MANLPPYSAQFLVQVVGETTEKTYRDTFTASIVLTQRQQLVYDQLFREYLGGVNPVHASQDARNRADILAEINSSLVGKVPQFWLDSAMGLDLYDDNVMLEVLRGIRKIQSEAAEKRKKKTDEAAVKLKDAVEQGPDKEEPPEE